jgi:hypothetical protein
MPENSKGRFSATDRAAPQGASRQAAEHQRVGLDGLRSVQVRMLRLFARIEQLGNQIDAAFAGQPFLPNLPPDAPANRRRFNAYFQEHKQVVRLFGRVLELWMITCGMKREDDWVPLIIEDMRRRAQQKGCENERRQSTTDPPPAKVLSIRT